MQSDASQPTDIELLQLLRSGDVEAAEEIVRRLTPLVSRLVFRLTGWSNDIQDLIQDIFLTIQSSCDSFRGESTLETWVTSIAVNRCRNWHRSNSRKLRLMQALLDDFVLPTDTTDRLEIHETVRMALKTLEHSERELVVLRYLEERTLNEISQATGLRKNTLEVRLYRARQKMLLAVESANQKAES